MEDTRILGRLRALNPHLKINSASDECFGSYGRVIKDFKGLEMLKIAKNEFNATAGTSYIASSSVLESTPDFRYLQRNVFGECDIQAGCCWGDNLALNGMEFHRSSEVIGAVSPMILMLGRLQDLTSDGWDSGRAECFLIMGGQWVELYSGALHLAPCRITSEIFRAIIILPEGTNTPLSGGPDGTLWMKNKWMLAHIEGPAAARGAAVRITGDNITLIPLS